MPDTPVIVGFVGFVRRYERGYTEQSGKRGVRDKEMWCSGGLKAWCEIRTGRTPAP
jgi:hypothetical protein